MSAEKDPVASDYRQVRASRQAALTDDDRAVYEQAYRDAGRAMELAELVYATRTEAGLTQNQLAATMGTSQSAIAAWKNGARIPGVDALERLAKATPHHHHRRLTRAPILGTFWANATRVARINWPDFVQPKADVADRL